MCNLECPIFDISIVPLILASVNSFVKIINDEVALYLIWGIYFALFLAFINNTTGHLCSILNIKIFTIPYPNKATKLQQ